MLVNFDPFILLFWIMITAFLPGVIIAFAIFKKGELDIVEKIFTGFAFGLVGSAAIPLLLFLFLGVKYSYDIALLSMAIFYAIAAALFIREKSYEVIQESIKTIKLPGFNLVNPNIVATFFLLLLIVLNFWVRMQTFSPIFYELDPYYYTYGATQLLTLGEMPFDDRTGWYPEARSSHRAAPLMIYMEALWYSFYNGNDNYNNYLLADIASIYPPIAAALAVFFMYLFVRSQYGKEAGLLAGGIAGFIPIFLTKTLAGEMEVQPYGFFALAFFFAMYGLAIKTKQIKFAVLAGIGYAVAVLGSSSQIIALAALIIFIPLQAIFLFSKDNKELLEFIKLNAIIILIGPVLSEIIKNLFIWQNISIIPSSFAPVGMLAFAGLLYYIKEKIADKEMALYALAGLFIAGIIAVFYTPLGEPVKGVIVGGLDVATYSTALQRTIAEQGVSGPALEGQLGFIGSTLPKDGVAGFLPVTISGIVDRMIDTGMAVLNSLLGTSVLHGPVEPSILFIILFFSILVFLYSLYRMLVLKENTLILFFFASLLPASIIGIIKEKFTIFTGFLIAGLVGVVLGEIILALHDYLKTKKQDENVKLAVLWAPLVIAFLLIYAQYASWGLPTALLSNSDTVRFQDNPLAAQQKFSYLCDQLKLRGGYDDQICQVAQDPVGYASQGTNYQYDSRLCSISLVRDVNRLLNGQGLTEEEALSSRFRCQRINDYWIESMEWISGNTEKNARITSWWDYGHWINFFGNRNTVLRNEHLSLTMIGEVAHGYVSGTVEELAAFMRSHDSKYALFDSEILFNFGTTQFGGKYGALNYLACARNNRTGVAQTTGISKCEQEHLWEFVYVPIKPVPEQICMISESAGITGTIGYYAVNVALPDGSSRQQPVAIYCISEQQLSDGRKIKISYYLDKKDEEGNLLANRGVMNLYSSGQDLEIYSMYYTNDPLWIQNGTAVGGYDHHKGKFYESSIYRALVLEDLPGFDLVFKSRNGEVKIYKLKE